MAITSFKSKFRLNVYNYFLLFRIQWNKWGVGPMKIQILPHSPVRISIAITNIWRKYCSIAFILVKLPGHYPPNLFLIVARYYFISLKNQWFHFSKLPGNSLEIINSPLIGRIYFNVAFLVFHRPPFPTSPFIEVILNGNEHS